MAGTLFTPPPADTALIWVRMGLCLWQENYVLSCEYHYSDTGGQYKAMGAMACVTAVCSFVMTIEQCLGYASSGKNSGYSKGVDTSFDSYM